jgi:cytoskeletal protein CcmA (bactofilin family)
MGLVLLAALFAVPRVRAFEGRGGDVVTIGADEVVEDDLYVGAGAFTLDGTIQGDLIVFGGTLTVNGTVEGDLIAAGQSVIVNGTVEDDARIAGYALTIQGDVLDDVVAAGFSLEGEEESSIAGDAYYAGYQALLAGEVGGDVNFAGGAVRIAGVVEGDASVDVGGTDPGSTMPPFYNFIPNVPTVPSVPGGLTMGEGARIGGDLTYTANARADLPEEAVAGEVDFNRYVTEREEKPRPSPVARAARWSFRQLRRLVTLLLVGALMMWAVPNWMRKLARNVEGKPLPSLGWGIAAIAAFGALMVLLVMASALLTFVFGLVTLGGLAGRLAVLGGIVTTTAGFGFSLLWRYVTTVVIGLLLGQLIFRALNSQAEENRWWPMVLGVVILVIVTAVPILGWLAKLAVVLFGLGAIWIWGLETLREQRAASPGAED